MIWYKSVNLIMEIGDRFLVVISQGKLLKNGIICSTMKQSEAFCFAIQDLQYEEVQDETDG